MDKGLATIIAVIIGGLIGFLSSFLTQRLNEKNLRRQLTIPKQIEAIEYISLTIFRLLSGENISRPEQDVYIKSCFWLDDSQSDFLSVFDEKDNVEYLKTMQRKILLEYEKIKKGE